VPLPSGCSRRRTSTRSPSDAVLRAVAADLEQHGEPLVWRWDRAACQRTPRVLTYLDAHGILVLYGPPRHPEYYGQLERQNREHRCWLAVHRGGDAEELRHLCASMLSALNTRWPRRALGWRTPAAVWATRKLIPHDLRACFRQEVYDRAQRLERKTANH